MPESQTDASAADDVLCAGDAVDIETALNQVSSSDPAWCRVYQLTLFPKLPSSCCLYNNMALNSTVRLRFTLYFS
jgi:hypothetical protein